MEKQRWEESERRRAEERSKKRKSQKKEDPGARKGRKVTKHCVFPMICGSGGSKSRLAKAAGAEPCGHIWEMKSCTPLWHQAHFQVKMYKAHQRQTTLGAHRCGTKHISKPKCTKHTRVGALLEVEMSKKCAPLRHEAHFQAKMYKTHIRVGALLEVEMSKKCTPLWHEAHFQIKRYTKHQGRSTFGSWDVEKVRAVVTRSTFPNQKVHNTPGSEHFWKLRCWKSARCCGAKHMSKSKVQKLTGREHFWTFRCRFAWPDGRRKGLCTLSKVRKRRVLSSISQNDGRRGTFEEDLDRPKDKWKDRQIDNEMDRSRKRKIERKIDRQTRQAVWLIDGCVDR